MSPKNRYRATFSWLVVSALVVLCAVVGYLQYRWIGEVTNAARDRLRTTLEASLTRASRDFNSEVGAAARDLLPGGLTADAEPLDAQLANRYGQWKSGRYARMFDRIGIVSENNGEAVLEILNPDQGVFERAEWPSRWEPLRSRLEARAAGGERGPGTPAAWDLPEDAFEIPVFGGGAERRPGSPFGRRPAGWVIFQLNLAYVGEVLIPEILQRHLGAEHNAEYQIAVVSNGAKPSLIYRTDPQVDLGIASRADASVPLLNLSGEQLFGPQPAGPGARRRGGPPRDIGPAPLARQRNGGGFGFRPGRGRGGPDAGRWTMFVQYRAGSLEAVVGSARNRNLIVAGGVLLLLAASVFALVAFTRQAQRLAALQMEFVAGVSHELRTPLTVLHTAGHNLQGKLSGNPAQVARYGALIQTESRRLEQLVEQVLLFARSSAGRIVKQQDPVSIAGLVDESLESSKPVIDESQCVVDKKIAPDLPEVLGDGVALKHALQNLLTNAAKYGSEDGRWIGISAMAVENRRAVEIRVADRGPGIPKDEQSQIFEPFFRGKRALEQQIHGTGLGLNLAKKIVEAHGGTILVKSQPGQGTEFTVRLPAQSAEPAA